MDDLRASIDSLRDIGGYTFEPVFDLGKQEIGIQAVAPEQPHGENVWSEGEQGGGLW